jgi:hypothetical protein
MAKPIFALYPEVGHNNTFYGIADVYPHVANDTICHALFDPNPHVALVQEPHFFCKYWQTCDCTGKKYLDVDSTRLNDDGKELFAAVLDLHDDSNPQAVQCASSPF